MSGGDHPPQAAYEAYETAMNVSVYPPWESLSDTEQAAWTAAANAAIEANG